MKTPRQILLDRHRAADAKLDALRHAVVTEHIAPLAERGRPRPQQPSDISPLPFLLRFTINIWRELIWPCRRIWTGLAAVWLALLVFNYSTAEHPQSTTTTFAAAQPATLNALRERLQMLAQLLEPREPLEATPPKTVPGPRGAVLPTIMLT